MQRLTLPLQAHSSRSTCTPRRVGLCADGLHKGSVILIASFILQAASKSSLPVNLLIFPLMIAVFYFLLIRPNQTKQKKWATMLSELKPGDRVTTTGGIRGTILTIKDDAIQLRVAPDNLKLEFVKSAIASVTTGEDIK